MMDTCLVGISDWLMSLRGNGLLLQLSELGWAESNWVNYILDRADLVTFELLPAVTPQDCLLNTYFRAGLRHLRIRHYQFN